LFECPFRIALPNSYFDGLKQSTVGCYKLVAHRRLKLCHNRSQSIKQEETRMKKYLAAFVGILAGLLALSFGSSSLRSAEQTGNPTQFKDPWSPAKEALDRLGKGKEFRNFEVKDKAKSEYVKQLEAWSKKGGKLKEFIFSGEYDPTNPKSGGAFSTRRTYVAREDDPRLYDYYEYPDLVAIAQAQGIQLRDAKSIREFLRGPSGLMTSVVQVDPKSLKQWQITLLGSGVPIIGVWLLELDDEMRPAKLTGQPLPNPN
jgi:hypothetical protein